MNTVIYHSTDFDGIFCREIAKKFLGETNTQFIGWNFGDPQLDYPQEGDVYVMDLSPDCFKSLPHRSVYTLIWIDHHKTSIEKYSPDIPGYRIDGVAACRLAYRWFRYIKLCKDEDDASKWPKLPDKQAYIDRAVTEPLAVRLAGEYDVWDKRDPGCEIFQCGLRSTENLRWDMLLDLDDESYIYNILDRGETIHTYKTFQDAKLVTTRGYDIVWEGLNFLVLNSPNCNSLTFKEGIKPHHDALLCYYFNGKCWTVSLYGCPNKPELDLSLIAKKYLGGGHKQACGFTCMELPF